MLDRIIDISCRVDYKKLSEKRAGKSSQVVYQRVEATRDRQRYRLAGIEGVSCNADIRPAEIHKFCDLDAASPGGGAAVSAKNERGLTTDF